MELIIYLFSNFLFISLQLKLKKKKIAVPGVLNGHINTNLQLIDPGIMHLKSD